MGPERLNIIYDKFRSILGDLTVDAVAIEGYAMGGNGKTFSLGELGGVLRLACNQDKLPLIEVPPTSLKKFITGKGNNPKTVVLKDLYKKYNLDINDDNDGDAAALALACFAYFEEELHLVETYRSDIQKSAKQIIGTHFNKMTVKAFAAEMGDDPVWKVEQKRRAKKLHVDH